MAPRTEEGSNQTHGDTVKCYLSGRRYELIGNQRFEVKAGDFIHIPACIWHQTVNGSQDEPLRYLAAQQYPARTAWSAHPGGGREFAGSQQLSQGKEGAFLSVASVGVF